MSSVGEKAIIINVGILRVIAFLIGIWVVYSVYLFPSFQVPLFLSLLVYFVILQRFSYVWLIVLPTLLPVLDLTPWTGRIVINEFDFLILTTFLAACWNGRLSFMFSRRPVIKWLMAAVAVSQIIGCLLGFFALQGNGNDVFYVYHEQANVIRAGKGFWEALLLLPLLEYENQRDIDWGKYLGFGMIGALLVFIWSVFWERLAFPGFFDVKADYRISGFFSSMLLGGAIVDGFLVLVFPFCLICFRNSKDSIFYWLGVGSFLGGLYCFLVTYTRSTYLAFLAILAVLFFGYKFTKLISLKRWMRVGVLIFVSASLVIPVIGGEFMQRRLSTVSSDFQHRLNHWGHALSLMNGSIFNYIVGMGVGSFPKYYSKETELIGSFSLKNKDIPFLSLSKSAPDGSLYVRQRFSMGSGGEYRVSAKVRTRGPHVQRLLIELCERNILPFLHECPTVELVIEPTQGKWVRYEKSINLSSYKNTVLSLIRPAEISIMNRGLKQQVDIAEISLFSPENEQLLKNNDFSKNFDFWVFSSGNHLAWHVKNQVLAVFFETGLFGLLAFGVLVLLLLRKSYGMVLVSNGYGVIFMACLCGIGVVGFFDSPFDDPRVSWLFYLICCSIAVGPQYRNKNSLFETPWRRLFMGASALFFLGIIAVITHFLRERDITFNQLFDKGVKELSSRSTVLEYLLKPQPKFVDIFFDGQIHPAHPRIVLPQLQSWQGKEISPFVADRISQYGAKKIAFISPCNSPDFLSLVSCRLIDPDATGVEELGRKMMGFSVTDQKASDVVSNAWQLAMAYDLSYSLLNQAEREQIESKIVNALRMTLDILDRDSMSMWHRRASHAVVAWICAIVLDGKNIGDIQTLRTRAQGHFLNAIDALAFTEVWPEGYNYWINERGFLYALAASAYVNGLDNAQQTERVKKVMRQVGYWHIYATRPDNRIEGYGDEGPRVDLKDETRRVIDLIAQMTKDPVLAGYSEYLAKLYGVESYYRDYRWGFLLFNDPSLAIVGDGSLESLGAYLLKTKLFGANSVNYAYWRSDWTKDATFITYKAGHDFSHHGHYDAGHFTLFKGKPLIVNSSSYGDIFSSNRLNYSIRTVAKNSLLIERPGERVRPNHLFKENVSDGGQRLTMPTGSNILSVEDWYRNYHANNHYEAAELLNYADAESFSSISSDLTPAYNNSEFDTEGDGGKVVSVLRNLVYLKNEDRLVVYDRIKSTSIKYNPKFLLHTIQKPQVVGERVLKGSLDNGIVESELVGIKVNNGTGYLVVNGLYPVDGLVRLIGGKDYKYYVESDADDSTLDGKNYDQGAQDKPWFDNAQWRIEIQSKSHSPESEFLVALSPSIGSYRQSVLQRLKVNSDNAKGVETDESVVAFSKLENAKYIDFDVNGNKNKMLLIGFDAKKDIVINIDGRKGNCSEFRVENVIEINCQDSVHGNVKIQFN